MEETKNDAAHFEEGEAQLSLFIKQAGDAARSTRKKVLEAHFDKLNQIIKESLCRVHQKKNSS